MALVKGDKRGSIFAKSCFALRPKAELTGAGTNPDKAASFFAMYQ
jgi:hypothetical protein